MMVLQRKHCHAVDAKAIQSQWFVPNPAQSERVGLPVKVVM